MHGELKERLETLTAPYGGEVRLDGVRFESGMRLLHVIIREGKRITVLDVDPPTARMGENVDALGSAPQRAQKRKHRPWNSFRYSSRSRASRSQSREGAQPRRGELNSR